ncbi:MULTISPECIES: hypothetical protein [Prochlorococcus]|uniref:hypothetical protein n=1 Tax=Prochlorococcus TaxID=1218 RepID=UPI0005337EE4|nr:MULTISPECIES: hypothetical protein [Prochlorococcus]KGG12177.1 hypothetical protein EV05_1382 [Prochlorococcus sp. MIT 0601]
METFKYILFGIAGLSMIFWVAVIALWHTYMLPRFFREDYKQNDNFDFNSSQELIGESGLANRGKYSIQSFVIADFNPIESGYGVNRLYTTMLISLGFMSFILLTYGLHSGFMLYGIS